MLKKNSAISIVVSCLVVSAFADDTNRSNWSGEIRGGYQYTDDSLNTANEFGLSSSIKYESNSWHNLVFGTRVAGVTGDGKTPEGIAFFDANNDAYGIVDELYIKGAFGNSELTIGRQAINLPFVDGDDGLGLIDNRFEAVVFSNKDIKDTTLYLAHIRSWSGVDSDDASKFNRINGNDGIGLAGVEYTRIENLNLKAFGYMANDFVNVGYLEANYKNQTDFFEYSTTLQHAMQDYNDGTKASVFGAGAELGLKSIPLSFNIAYNKNFDNGSADILFGGGPFVTSMHYYTMEDAGGKGQVLKGGIGYELTGGLSINANYAKIDRNVDPDAKELDIDVKYKFNDHFGAHAIYSNINDGRDGDMKNITAYVTYKF